MKLVRDNKLLSSITSACTVGALALGIFSTTTPAYSDNSRCAPLAVQSAQMHGSAKRTLEGFEYRVFINGYVGVQGTQPYLGQYDGRKPATVTWYTRHVSGGENFNMQTMTRYMGSGRYQRIVANKPVEVLDRVVHATDHTLTLSTTTVNPECSHYQDKVKHTHFTFDLKPLQQGKAARLISTRGRVDPTAGRLSRR